jgi:putative ABC transport system substrate-binding protein
VIGFLSARSPDESTHLVAALQRGLAENGYIDGKNITIEYRWALGRYDWLPALAADLVRLPVAVLMTGGGEPSALAAKAATTTIPIVFSAGGDPVKGGLVASLSRPGGNATGVSNLSPALEAKRLGLLHELVPKAVNLGVLLNPNFPPAVLQLTDVLEAASAIGVQVQASGRAQIVRSRRHSTRLLKCALPGSRRPPIRFLRVGAFKWSRWLRGMPYQRSTNFASMPRSAG